MDGKEMKESDEKDLGVYVNTSMKFSRQCAESTKQANRVMGIIKRNFINFDRKVVLNLYKSLIRPHLDYCIQVWRPYLKKKDISLLEGVQRRMTSFITGMESKSYEDLITLYNITQGEIVLKLGNFVEFIRDSKTRGNSKRITPPTVRLEVRRNSFFSRVWKTWNKLPEKVVTAPTLNTFKNRLMECGIFKGQ
ncbi:hypothetical protein HOLleu_32304 [Holothuria leucospilota]|uniref:Uncharacterized protein n=1 Tax=Holothuria leucospilota TaxID=206669 RepID=A0A9Q0YTY1_HOLLE|nr:hypothetical protein HOLleu_32304 [Holothuria leucospilota]